MVGAQIPDLSGAVQGRISALRPSDPGTTSPAARLLGEVKLVWSYHLLLLSSTPGLGSPLTTTGLMLNLECEPPDLGAFDPHPPEK